MARQSEAYAIVVRGWLEVEVELQAVSRYMTLDAGNVEASTRSLRSHIVSSVAL